MKESAGTVFSVAKDNQPVAGCTISKAIYDDNGYYITHFSLAENTSISAESYEYHKLMIVADGDAEIFTDKVHLAFISKGEILLLPTDTPVGVRTDKGCVYTEIGLRKDTVMNNVIKDGNVFTMKDLLPYQKGKIVNMDIAGNEKMKFVIMSFDEGTGLAEHAAPGEALIFALDGEGIIGYEGKETAIKAGENFKFAKYGKHYVKAKGKFKIALLLTLD